jgi:hypothetical protein
LASLTRLRHRWPQSERLLNNRHARALWPPVSEGASLEGGKSALADQQDTSSWDTYAGDLDLRGSPSQVGRHSEWSIVGNLVVDEKAAAGQFDPPDARSFVLLPQRRQCGVITHEQLRHD